MGFFVFEGDEVFAPYADGAPCVGEVVQAYLELFAVRIDRGDSDELLVPTVFVEIVLLKSTHLVSSN